MSEETYTVPQVAARLERALDAEFPEAFWLVGETSGMARGPNRSSGHWYFTLVDDQCEDDSKRASLRVVVWRQIAQRLFGPRRCLEPSDGIVVRALVRPSWYAPRGELSFLIEDIDPEFTYGNLDRQRRELLQRLQKEGALEWNKRLPFPDVPLRIGLLTSLESAAYHDFRQTLESSGIAFELLVCDTRVQGPQACPSIVAGLGALGRLAPDLIALVRGGGSRLDLSWFDREEIVRAVATCPVPVLTGIGHEIDSSVADAAAHRAFKTPTAVAEFLVELAQDGRRHAEQSWAAIAAQAGSRLDGAGKALEVDARRVRHAVEARMGAGAAALTSVAESLRHAVWRAFAEADGALRTAAARLRRGPHLESLALCEQALVAASGRLQSAAGHALQLGESALEGAEARARLLDPRRVLARGYAILLRADGSPLKDAAAAAPGEPIRALLRDGELDATVVGRRS